MMAPQNATQRGSAAALGKSPKASKCHWHWSLEGARRVVVENADGEMSEVEAVNNVLIRMPPNGRDKSEVLNDDAEPPTVAMASFIISCAARGPG
jgi:hypothetical protein